MASYDNNSRASARTNRGTEVPFHEVLLELQKEIHQNKELQLYMIENVAHNDGFDDKLSTIAAYFNIEMDGWYVPIDVARVLLDELKKANSIIWTAH